jgi:4-amino-4-deoxy-L-arabinose transferase-like glycosyltransferase
MNRTIMKKLWLLVAVGAILRVAGLGTAPPALISDEILMGYDGACVYRTGMDHHGQSWPVFFKQSGEYRPPVYVYFSGLFSAPFGVNTYTVRLPSAVLGIMTIIMAFYFGREFQNERFGLLLAALVAFSPWNLHYSRVGWEMILLVFFQLTALTFFFRWRKNSSVVAILAATFCFGITIYTYPTAKLFTPMLLFFLCILYWKELQNHRKQFGYCIVLFLGLMIPYLVVLVSTKAALEARWAFLSVFQYSDWVSKLIRHYFLHLSPVFLFIKGGANPLHAMPGGVALLVLLPFFYVGLWRILYLREKKYLFVLLWFLTFAIPSSMTHDLFDSDCMPNALRSVAGMPVIEIISGIGLLYMTQIVQEQNKHSLLAGILSVALALNLAVVGYIYVMRDTVNHAMDWQYGIEDLVEYTERVKDEYDTIVVSHSIRLHPIAVAIYSGRDIKPFTGSDFPKYVLPFFHYVPMYQDFRHRDYVKYGTIAKWYNLAPGKNLLVAKPGEISFGNPITQFFYPDGSVAFECYAMQR